MKDSPPPRSSALAPLRESVFRLLWLAWLAANVTMWMNEVAAAWLMTSLTSDPLLVALVQAASTLPVFVLGLPSGALADIVDRRAYFASTQLWVSLVAIVLSAFTFMGSLSAPLLLALAFANGIGMAMRLPVFAAIVPTIVSRADLPSALALNGVAMNLSRIVGPLLAGAVIASAGTHYVFLLNAVLSIVAFVLITRWRPAPSVKTLPGERFFAAIRVGLQHVRQSPRMRIVLLRVFLFFLQSTSLTALLPLIARDLQDQGPGAFTALLGAMGAGAILLAFLLPHLRGRLNRDAMLTLGTFTHALAATAVVLSPTLWTAVPAMIFAGMAWLGTANSLSVTAQYVLPDWVRARGMSIYQMALMGGMAAGAALWGYVASLTTVTTSIAGAAIAGPLLLLLTRPLGAVGGEEEDLSPVPGAANVPAPVMDIQPDEGPVMVTIEYLIDPARSRDFKRVMEQTRKARLRQGVLSWGLFRDTAQPGRFVEYFVDENWIEHQRRIERFTAADWRLRQLRLEFHLGAEAPRVRRYVA